MRKKKIVSNGIEISLDKKFSKIKSESPQLLILDEENEINNIVLNLYDSESIFFTKRSSTLYRTVMKNHPLIESSI